MYKVLILPIYDYCDYIHWIISDQDAEILQKLQNCAFRNILQVKKPTPTQTTHETLNMDTLHIRRTKHVATQIHRYTSKMCNCPPKCSSMFQPLSEQHSRNARQANSENLVVTRVHLNTAQINIRYFVPAVWSKIPEHIKFSRTLDEFKSQIKNLEMC